MKSGGKKSVPILLFDQFATPTIVQVIWILNLSLAGLFVIGALAYLIVGLIPHYTTIDVETSRRGKLVELVVRNLGNSDANNVVVFIGVPEGITIESSDASVGETDLVELENGTKQLEWRVGGLRSEESERLVLQVESTGPPSLNVTWDSTAIGLKLEAAVWRVFTFVGSLFFWLVYLPLP